ncbi:MAG: ABC transporter ATP-binding protein [Gammaproteobacteria bacterium]|nr:ABC transporter ATP-binding protein [Gammaproteobacteria bacterium]
MLRTEHLTRYYSDFRAVNNVSFEVNSKEIVGLLGQNGAGKTTVLKMITGFLEPSSGAVLINGEDINQLRLTARDKIGYLPENCPLYADMTVTDFLFYTANLRNLKGSHSRKAVQQALVRTELIPKANANIQTLSRGYKQRVGVAQAILTNPEILILDEPTNGLDPLQVENMRGLLKQLAVDSTVIVSTHVLHEVGEVCDRVLIMKQGELVLDSKLSDLRNNEQVLISVDKSPGRVLEDLNELDQVKSVEYLGEEIEGFRYRITANDISVERFAPELTRKLVQSEYNVVQITPEIRDLESVFRNINQDYQ